MWLGFDNSASLHEYAAQLALPIWVDYMRPILTAYKDQPRLQPEGIITARINLDSGLLTSSEDTNSLFEMFDINNMPDKQPSVNVKAKNNVIKSVVDLFE